MHAKLVCLAALSLAACPAHADQVALKDSVPHITTRGTASIEVVPDRAELSLGIANERPDAEAATQVTARAAADVVAEIKARGSIEAPSLSSRERRS